MTYKIGSRGEIVKQIQKALHLYEDGIYGINTEEAVKKFQASHGLKPDGIVGAATLAKLIPVRWKKSRRTIREIIIHCSATPEGRNYTVEDIRRWHRQQGRARLERHRLPLRDLSGRNHPRRPQRGHRRCPLRKPQRQLNRHLLYRRLCQQRKDPQGHPHTHPACSPPESPARTSHPIPRRTHLRTP